MEQVQYTLPDNWAWKTLDDVSEKITDGTHHSPKAQHSEWESGRFKYITSKNIKNNGMKLDDISYIDQDIHNEIYARCPPEIEDQLLTKDGAMTGTCCLNELDEPFSLLSSVALIKQNRSIILPKYLNYYLQSHIGQNFLLGDISGAAITRTNIKKLKSTPVPLAPFSEQKCIVEKLDALLTRIDSAIEHLQESVTLANALYASELASVFSSGQDKWPLRELNEVAEVARGKSKHRPRNDKSLFGGEYPFIQTGDVRNAQKYITTYSATYNEEGLQQSKLWPKDTICLTIAANIGDVAILGMAACFPDSVVGISSTELETDYLYYFLTTLQQQLDSKANAAAQKNINLKILSEIKIPVPTLDEQKNIIRQINEIDRLSVKVKAEISEKITKMQQLKASILDSAFKGEL